MLEILALCRWTLFHDELIMRALVTHGFLPWLYKAFVAAMLADMSAFGKVVVKLCEAELLSYELEGQMGLMGLIDQAHAPPLAWEGALETQQALELQTLVSNNTCTMSKVGTIMAETDDVWSFSKVSFWNNSGMLLSSFRPC